MLGPAGVLAELELRQSDKGVVRVLPGHGLVRASRNRRLLREFQSQLAGRGYQCGHLIAAENLPGQTVYVRTVRLNLVLPIVRGDEKQLYRFKHVPSFYLN